MLGGRNYTFIIQISQVTELFQFVEFYSEDSPKCLSSVTLEKRHCTFIIQVFQNTELLKSEEVYSEDGLEMPGLYLEDGLEMIFHQ